MTSACPAPRFLLLGKTTAGDSYFWTWIPGQKVRPLLAENSAVATWMSGDAFVKAAGSHLLFVDRGKILKDMTLPGQIQDIGYLPSQRKFRFTLYAAANIHTSLWEVAEPGGAPRRLTGYPDDPKQGTWGPSGRLFSFVAPNPKTNDIWVASDQGAHGAGRDKITRVTDGPLDYAWPTPAIGNDAILAIGTRDRWELVGYEAAKHRFMPFLGGRSACELDFSRDGRKLT